MSDTTSHNVSNACILAINGGSSSIKFAVYSATASSLGTSTGVETGACEATSDQWLHGELERIGSTEACLTSTDLKCNEFGNRRVPAGDHISAARFLLEWLEARVDFASIQGIGHRVVHGMRFVEPTVVTQEVIAELRGISPYDPDHMPLEITLIEAFQERHPHITQVACFDTTFHRTMPRVAQLLPIPRRFDAAGIRRYGFHGLSYAYLVEELARVAGDEAADGRVIMAHLGNGASITAFRHGKSVDTSMGFTPAGGLPMGTRTGDLDPGVAWHLMRTGNLTPEQFNMLINHESGLLGVSETKSDMRDLIERQASDVRATEAVELFCYSVRKWIGAYAAVLGGVETLVFSGGIGENSAEVRAHACKGLEFLGIALDHDKNSENAPVISTEESPVTVRVIRTDEELMIARTVRRLINA